MKNIKSLQLLFVSLLFILTGAHAQSKAVKTEKIETPTVHCEKCKLKIEQYLSRVDGIQTVKVDFKKKITTVKYITDRTNIEAIKTDIANLGYDAGDVEADEAAYKRLPKSCQTKKE